MKVAAVEARKGKKVSRKARRGADNSKCTCTSAASCPCFKPGLARIDDIKKVWNWLATSFSLFDPKAKDDLRKKLEAMKRSIRKEVSKVKESNRNTEKKMVAKTREVETVAAGLKKKLTVLRTTPGSFFEIFFIISSSNSESPARFEQKIISSSVTVTD